MIQTIIDLAEYVDIINNSRRCVHYFIDTLLYSTVKHSVVYYIKPEERPDIFS